MSQTNHQIDDRPAHPVAMDLQDEAARVALAKARSLLDAGESARAIALCRQHLPQQPAGAAAAPWYEVLGLALASAGQRIPALWAFLHQGRCAGWADAELAYSEYQTVAHCPIERQWLAHHNLGRWLRDRHCWIGALAALEQAIALDSSQVSTWAAIGDLWRDRPDYAIDDPQRIDRAVAAYLQALYRNPTYLRPYDRLFKLLKNAGQFEAALSCGRKWIPRPLVVADRERSPLERSVTTLPHHAINPPETVQLRDSRSPLGEPPHPDLQATSYQADPTFVVELPQGRAWADHFTSAVFTDQDALITELSLGSAELVALSEHLPPPQHLAGNGALLSVAGGSMFCHWLLNLLSRLRLLEAAGWPIERLDWIAVNEQTYPYQIETLELLGIPRHKLIVSNPDYRHITADRLIVPSRVDRATPWMCQTLRRLFLQPDILGSIIPHDRLYISRDRAHYRRVVEDKQLSSWLVRTHGFKIVLLETLSFAQQVALLARAKVVVAPHGAGLTNLVFCQPGTIVVELFSPRYVPSYFWEIADLMDLQHYHLVGEPLATHPDPQAIEGYQFSDPGADGIWIPFDRFQRAIDHLLLTPLTPWAAGDRRD